MGSSIADHPVWILSSEPAGGFTLAAGNADSIRVVPDGLRWRVEWPGREHGRWLNPLHGGDSPGFVLGSEDGSEEEGRITPRIGDASAAGLYYLLLGDGRLFCATLRGPRDGRFELHGWETPGAYLIARPERAGWLIEPTPASGGLRDIRAVTVLFAAGILAADGALSRPTVSGEPMDSMDR